MKRVFAHVGFSVALTLFILNFFNVTFALIMLGMLCAFLLISFTVPKIRAAGAVPLCLGSAVFACLIFISGVYGSYTPQTALDGKSGSAVFYITETQQYGDSYYYTVQTKEICIPDAPQNIKIRIKSDTRMDAETGAWVRGDLSFEKIADNSYASMGKFADHIFLQAEAKHCSSAGGAANRFSVGILQMRSRISSILLSSLKGDYGALACALLTGNKQYISDAVVSAFYAGGATHLMAVSGLHLSVIAGSLYWLLKRLYVPVLPRTLVTFAVILVYDGIAGFSPSVMRASLMMAVLLSGRLFKRKSDGINSLGFALFVLCLNPFAVTDVGLLLSVASALALMTASPALCAKIHCRVPIFKALVQNVCASVSVILYTMPILWFTYGKAVFLSVVTNLLLIPAAEYTMIVALLLVLFSKVGVLGYFFATLTGFGTGFLMKLTAFFSASKIGALDLSSSYTGIGFACVFLLFGLTFVLQYQKHLKVTAWLSVFVFVFTMTVGHLMDTPKTYICANKSAVMIYSQSHAMIAGNMDQQAYYHFKKIVDNKALHLSMILCSDRYGAYYNQLLTRYCETDNFVISGLDTQTATQINCESIWTDSQFDVDLWDGNHVSYNRNGNSFTLLLHISGFTIRTGSNQSDEFCDFAVVWSESDAAFASQALVCSNMQANEFIITELQKDRNFSLRRESIWLL